MSESEEIDYSARHAEYSLTDQAMTLDDPRRGQWDGDEHLYVRFFHHPKQNAEKSAREGRPIFEEREYVEIVIPGDKDNIIFRPVQALDKMRFSKLYNLFQEGKEQAQDGTPLEQWPGVNRALVEEFKFFRIRTVEQLVNMADSVASKFPGIHSIQERARVWLDAANDGSVATKLQKELEDSQNTIETMQAAIDDLGKRLTAKENEDKPATLEPEASKPK